MIPAPLNFRILDGDITDSAFRLGYHGYLPIDVIRDISHLFIMRMLNMDLGWLYALEYNRVLIELLDMVESDKVETCNPIEFAVNILKLISPKVNLRLLNIARSNGSILIPIDENNSQQNYNVDLSLLSVETKELLGVDTNIPVNEIVLSDDVLDVIQYYNGMKKVPGDLLETVKPQVSKISKLSDFHKSRKYRLALPSFITDLALKKLLIKTSEVILSQNNKVTVLVDVSWSTTKNPKYFLIVKGVLLALLDSFIDGVSEITIMEFHNTPSRELVITTKDMLKEYINYKPSPIVGPPVNWRSMYHHIHKFDGQSVIFITDGRETITTFPSNIKLFCVSTGDNKLLETMCINTGGKLVLV